MTVLEDRIEMAEQSGELTLDVMFECLEKMPIPEGTKVEIVGGNIFMSPQGQTHWEIIADIYEQLRARYPRKADGLRRADRLPGAPERFRM